MGRTKQAFRYLSRTLIGIFLAAAILLFVSGLVFMIPSVQTRTAQKVAGRLSDELQTEISIEKLRLHWNLDIEVGELCIRDRKGEPMLAIGKMQCRPPRHIRSQHEWRFQGIDVERLLFYMARYKGEEGNNMKFLFDSFKSDKNKEPVRLVFKDIKLKDGEYTWYHEAKCEEDLPGVWNYDNIRLKEINAEMESITVDSGECILDIRNLSCREHSGFSLHDMRTLLTVSNRKLYLENTLFNTPAGSRIDMDFRFDFDSWSQYSDFEDSVLFRCQLRPSLLHTSDLGYFAAPLQEATPLTARLQGKVDNCLSKLEIRQFACMLDDSIRLTGDLYTERVQTGRNAHWDAEIRELSVPLQTIEGLKLPGGTVVHLPEKLKNAVIHHAEGDFHGRFDEFTADADVKSSLGEISANGSFQNERGKKRYHARMQTRGFQLHQILESSPLGALTAQGEIHGSASDIDEYRLDVQSLELNGQDIRHATLRGDMDEGRLSVHLDSRDTNLQADIKGFVDFKQNSLCYAVGEIRRINLSQLGLLPKDSNATLSMQTQADLTLAGSEAFSGTVSVSRASLTQNGRSVRIPTFQLKSEQSDQEKELLLQSAPLQAALRGMFRLEDLLPAMIQIARNHLPHSNYKEMPPLPENTAFTFTLHQTRPLRILEELLPAIRFGDRVDVEAEYAESGRLWQMQASAPGLRIRDMELDGSRISSETMHDTLHAEAYCDRFMWKRGDSLSALNIVSLVADCRNDTAVFRLKNRPESASSPTIDLPGIMLFNNYDQCVLQLQEGMFRLDKADFTLAPGSEITHEIGNIQLHRLKFSSGEQQVAIDGNYATRKPTELDIRLRQLNLSELESLIEPFGVSIGGIATGDMRITGEMQTHRFTTILGIDSFQFNDVTYGRLESNARWQEEERLIRMDANLYPLTEEIPALRLYGSIQPDRQWIDLNGDIRTFNLHSLTPYLSSFATSVEGNASGQLHYAGPLREAALSGKLLLEEAELQIGYINTKYIVRKQEIEIRDSAFIFDNFSFTDELGHPAVMKGKATHRHLADWGVRLDIDADNTMLLNTDYRDNELFYGKAYGTGGIRLLMPPGGDFYIGGSVRTENQTYISILLNKGAAVQKQQSYIVFEKPYSAREIADSSEGGGVRSSKTHLQIQLDVTPDATVKVVLDPSIGGTITGNGSGSIRMELQPDRPFEMYGSCTLTEGSVDLALGNVFTRTLKIENGSSISWNGLPDKGEMNVRASYSTRTSITALLGESSVTSSYRSVPVSTGLRLKGALLNPEFSFDIRLDDVDESIRSMAYNALDTTDREEMFRQAFSLMLLGRFDTQRSDGSGENNVNYSIGYSLSELFSHYLQKMISTLTDKVNVGLLYRPGDGISSGDEYNMQLSTNLMENRLSIQGSLDIYGENSDQNDRQAVAGNVVGDIVFEYKITRDGSLRVKAFNMANYYDVLSAAYSDVPYYQGIGITFTKDFNTIRELFTRNRR